MIRDGFDESAIEFLSDSALQDTNIICDILRDTHKVGLLFQAKSLTLSIDTHLRFLQALDLVLSIAHDTSKLTVELLYELHDICMKTTSILPIVVRTSTGSITGGSDSPSTSSEYHALETQPQALEVEAPALPLRSQPMEVQLKYTNVKLTRQATKKNVVIAGPPRVQFCPFDDIVGELGRFVHLARVRTSCLQVVYSWLIQLYVLEAMAEELGSKPIRFCCVASLGYRNNTSF